MIGRNIVSNVKPNNLTEEINPRTFSKRIKFDKRFFKKNVPLLRAKQNKTKQNENKS